MSDDYVSQKWLQRRWSMQHSALQHYINDGRLKTVTIAGRRVIARAEVQRIEAEGGFPTRRRIARPIVPVDSAERLSVAAESRHGGLST